MNRLFRLCFPGRWRRPARRPAWLLGGVFLCSGCIRDLFPRGLVNLMVTWSDQAGVGLGTWMQLPAVMTRCIQFVTPLLISIVATLIVLVVVARLIIDFPAYTKAIFWAVIRSYEHNPSRQEMLRLVMLPSSFCVAILADGFVSVAAFLLGAICLRFLSKSYQLKRLNALTRDIMRMRSNLGFVAPQHAASAEPFDD